MEALKIIDKIKNRKHKLELLLLLIEEYGGTLQNCKSVGLMWGAGGEEYRVNKEYIETKKKLKKLKKKVIEIALKKV